MGKAKTWTCKECKEAESLTVTFTEFQKSASRRKSPDKACCDNFWHLWAPCIKCKKKLPRASFDLWMDAMPSRKHSGKSKLMRCNECMREDKDATTQLSRQDVSVVMQKRKKMSRLRMRCMVFAMIFLLHHRCGHGAPRYVSQRLFFEACFM